LQTQVARIADDTIDAAGDERVPRLDCDQAAESLAEHEDRPQRQGPANRKETYAQLQRIVSPSMVQNSVGSV